jgi:hypothetical protein
MTRCNEKTHPFLPQDRPAHISSGMLRTRFQVGTRRFTNPVRRSAMKGLLTSMMMSVGFLMAAGAQAQVPAAAPAGTTALCKDGSYVSNDTKKGACRGHKGVKDWYGAPGAGGATAAQPETKASQRASKKSMAAESAAAATGAAAMPSHGGASMPMTPAAPMSATAPMPNHAPMSAGANPESQAAAPGGGNGKVWVNDESKVYHCADDRYYGKTKKGEYMSEADAVAKGNHASHGKACAK